MPVPYCSNISVHPPNLTPLQDTHALQQVMYEYRSDLKLNSTVAPIGQNKGIIQKKTAKGRQ